MVLTRYGVLISVIVLISSINSNAAETSATKDLEWKNQLHEWKSAIAASIERFDRELLPYKTPSRIESEFNQQAQYFRQYASEKAEKQRKALWGDQKRPKTVPVAAKPTRPSY